ncbi:hypothetical protein [Streptomyces sp. NPDC013187]
MNGQRGSDGLGWARGGTADHPVLVPAGPRVTPACVPSARRN